VRVLLALALGVVAALLVSCSSSGGGGLIPAANAGPLKGDFEAVSRAAENGNGNCSETETLLSKTELDFKALPTSVDRSLNARLEVGIDNLKKQALALCVQPLPVTTTATTTTTTPTKTTPPPTTTTSTETTPTTSGPGGGTPPEEKESDGVGPNGEGPPGKSGGSDGGTEAGK
jgi:hypothetical protein